nr:cupin-like domain-containing protein [Pseudomonas veronii]
MLALASVLGVGEGHLLHRETRWVGSRYFAKSESLFQSFPNQVLEQGADIFEGTISAGDAFYIPPGWWHNVINCGFTIAVQNLHVDTYRFPLFEQQMRGFVLPILSKIEDLGRDAREELFNAEKTLPPLLSHQIGGFIEHEKNYIMFLRKSAKKSEDFLNNYHQ